MCAKMIVTAIIIVFFIVLFFIIWFTTITIVIDYSHMQDDDHFNIKLSAWKFIRHTIEVPVVKIDKEEPHIIYKKKNKAGEHETNKITPHEIKNRFSDYKELMQHVFDLNAVIQKFLKTVKVKKLEWHSYVGLKDAAQTGVLTGVVWSIKGVIIGLLSKYMRLKTNPVISVQPSFQIPVSQTKIKCMFKIRIGNAILAGLKILKFWRGGKGSFKTKPLNAMSKDENNHSI
ncbi:DUF2953 domain-containing protein [Bacillus sp. FJAT-49736]|uniref:DUF2953 domain-containing protein n=1 Tax=Bacillus sp. FJAT-49736 TaxID=2833582 RepID=UPI001BC93E6F|nr:DUF2953 domain-containing protein [Bacillus sp. FJAT-49736]MBS4173817.1 DUF2953 domain-containing protein [Bacillus sp. FJAT-49736]